MADDRTIDVRQVTQAREVVQGAHRTTRVDRDRYIVAEFLGQCQRFLDVGVETFGALVNDAGDTRHLQIADQVPGHERGLRLPAVDHYVAAARRQVHDDTAGMAIGRLDHQLRFGYRNGS